MRIRSRACLWITLALAAGCTASAAPEGQPGAETTPDASSATAPAQALEGTEWRLAEVGGRPARVVGGAAAPSLRLDGAEDRASGNSGCNGFSGPYVLQGASLRLGPLASTRRACTDEEMNRQETALFQALESTRTWRVTGDTLVLSGDAGPVARFTAGAAR